MKTLIFCIVLMALAGFCNTFAQTPQAIPYQAVARNAAGAPLASQTIAVRFSIRDSIITGTIVYRETHTVVTNSLGLFNLNVGKGAPVSGALFANINWGKNAKFLQVEMDPAGGSAFVDLGTQQMMSVPYSLYAENSGNGGFTNMQVFDTPGTFSWTAPQNVKKVKVDCWGGGAGGVFFAYGSPAQLRYYSGAAGGYGSGIYSVNSGEVYNVSVGTGGTNYSNTFTVINSITPLVGAFGSPSSFGSFIQSTGAGYYFSTSGQPGTLDDIPGTSNGQITIESNGGSAGWETSGSVPSFGGSAPLGGAGADGVNSTNGKVPGGGGVSGGNGGHGRVIIWW